MISKSRIFFNWLGSVFAGSVICAFLAFGIGDSNDNFMGEIFTISLVLSAVTGLIPLISMIASHSTTMRTGQHLGFKKRLITIQIINYFVIFSIITAICMSEIPELYFVSLVGLPYLLAGISITFATPSEVQDSSETLEQFIE